MTLERPPEWAEVLLRLSLRRADRESVSGDLLEEYRASIVPARGRRSADAWYVRQMAGFVWRATWLWAVLFSGAFVARQAWDVFVPTHDFVFRSELTTYTGVALLAATAFWIAWRSASFAAGMILTILMSQIAAVMSVIGVTALLAIRHDAATLQAAADSGGIEEAYILPFIMVIPALIVGSVGSVAGKIGATLATIGAKAAK
jgi:hypothetical protein